MLSKQVLHAAPSKGVWNPFWKRANGTLVLLQGKKGETVRARWSALALSPLTHQKKGERTEKLGVFFHLPVPYKTTMPVTMRTGCQLNILREPSQARPPSQRWLQYTVSPKHKMPRFPTRIEYGRNGIVGISMLPGSTPEKIKQDTRNWTNSSGYW